MELSRLPGLLFYSDNAGVRLFRHLSLFILMNALFILIAWNRPGGEGELMDVAWMVFINSLFFFGYAYITAFILFPLLLFRRRFVFFFFCFILSGLIISYLKFIFSDYVFYDEIIARDLGERMLNVRWPQLITNTKDMTFIVAVFLIAKFAKDNHSIRTKLEALKTAQLETEMKVIGSQLDAHVLFNNLNNLYSLSVSKSDLVVPVTRRLKSLLHYYFSDGKCESISLDREIQVIRDYIDMEKMRYGDRLDVQLTLPRAPGKKEIVPFVLFPFVQNCFEHGLSIDAGRSWLKVSIKTDGDQLHFMAANSKPAKSSEVSSNDHQMLPGERKKQLDLFYRGKYQLIVEDSNNEYRVSLKLKL